MSVCTNINRRRARAGGLCKAGLFAVFLLLAACTHRSGYNPQTNRSANSAPAIGPLTYNPATRGFERPWPFGPARRY